MPDTMIGKTLGQYQIVQLAGKGGMATVYKAFQPSLNRFVAIKVLPDHLAADDQFVARFKQEALSAAALRHPNILVIHDVGQDGNLHYIAMEFLEGRPLADVIQQAGGLDPRRVAGILEQVASALDFAHSRKVIHRDIKPANIFLSADDHVTLVDFGIAKALSSAAGLTRAGMIVGTPEYMSPEQVDGRALDARSDIYSLGVVLYQMLTGYVPFGGESPSAVMMAHLTKAPMPPSQFSAFVTPGIESVVMRALAKNPNDRFASVREMAQAFSQAVYSGRPVPVRPAAPTMAAMPAPTAGRKPSAPIWPILAGMGVVALIVVAVVALLASGILKLGGGAVGPATPGLQAAGAPTAAPTSTLIPTYTPEPPTLTPSPTPTPRPTQTPVPTVILQPTTARPTATPTKAGPTKTPQPAATYTPTAANEPRAVTLLSPMPGTRFRTSQITFKWTGGALQGGETFLVEIIPYQAEKKNTCMFEGDYGRGGHQYSPPLTAHEWTHDIAAVPVGVYKPCAGSIEWVVHIKDASGAIVLSTPRGQFVWNPLG
jgi:predicted Ser/Thr protein kinase